MIHHEIRHTASLSLDVLARLRELLDHAFDGKFADADFDHALGGMHVLVWDADALVGHGSVVQRRLLYEDRALRCGYVEAIAVHADHRRAGHGATIMREIGDLVQGAYELGALGASDMAMKLYEAHGWRHWRGELRALTPDGVAPTPDSRGAVMVLPTASATLDLDATLTCDWRDGEVW